MESGEGVGVGVLLGKQEEQMCKGPVASQWVRAEAVQEAGLAAGQSKGKRVSRRG